MDSDIDLYTGAKRVDQFSLELFEGEATLACEISERWEEVLARTIKCGAGYKHILKSRRGISKTEKTDLESAVKGTIGLASIAQLEGTISGKAGIEVKLEYSSELEEEYTFSAPQCGRRIIKLYQQQRLCNLNFTDRRRFRRGTWAGTFIIWLNRIHDASRNVDNDPDCGCPKKETREPDGRFYITIGSTTLLASFVEEGGQIYLPELKARLPRSFSWSRSFKVNLERRMLPDYLLFLAREDARSFQAHFSLLEANESVQEKFDQKLHSQNAEAFAEA